MNIKFLLLWFVFFLLFLSLFYINKLTAIKMAKRTIETKHWACDDFRTNYWNIPIALMKPAYGDEAIKSARTNVVIADIFLWSVILSFIILGLFLLGD